MRRRGLKRIQLAERWRPVVADFAGCVFHGLPEGDARPVVTPSSRRTPEIVPCCDADPLPERQLFHLWRPSGRLLSARTTTPHTASYANPIAGGFVPLCGSGASSRGRHHLGGEQTLDEGASDVGVTGAQFFHHIVITPVKVVYALDCGLAHGAQGCHHERGARSHIGACDGGAS